MVGLNSTNSPRLSSTSLSSLSNGAVVSQWDDLSTNQNHLTQGATNAQPEYNKGKASLQFKRNSDNLDHMDFTTGLALSEFTLFFALSFGSEDRQVLLQDTDINDLIEILYLNANRASLKVNANDANKQIIDKL